MKKLILASASLRRKELLERAGFRFEIVPSHIDETFDKQLNYYENVMKTALKKGEDIFQHHPDDVVLSADTIVVYQGEVFGKPRDRDDAKRMLQTLSGKEHQVITGVAILSGEGIDNFYIESLVRFNELTEEEIDDYISTGEPMDKAGAYAIQGIGKKLVSGYTGSFTNIVGLPIEDIENKLKKQL